MSENWKTKVHPELVKRVERLIANLAQLGHDVRVHQSLRTDDEQNALYAKGRTKPGKKVTNAKAWQSNHNYGLAVDLVPFINGQFTWQPIHIFQLIGREAKKLGLEWGGDWKAVDMPHVQLKGLSIKECYALYLKGGLQQVWSRMYEILGGAAVIGFKPAEDDILEFRDRGDAVTALQQQLVKLNLLQSHEVDGTFGKITKNAVIGFQRQNNLTADGIVGDGTKAKLKSAIEKLESKKVSAAENPSDENSVRPPRSENQPPNSEQPTTETKIEVKDGTVKVETSENKEPQKKIAIEKTEPKGFIATIRAEIAALVTGNGGVQAGIDKAQQAQTLGLSSGFWKTLGLIVVVGSIIYLIYRYLDWRSDVKRDLQLTNKLIEANSTADNQVYLVDKEHINFLDAKEFEVIRR